MKQSTIALALLPLLFSPVTKARTPEMPVLEKPGCSGAILLHPAVLAALTGDQTAALRDSLSDKPAKKYYFADWRWDGGTRKLLLHAIMPKVRAAF